MDLGGADSFPFNEPGDSVEGEIISVSETQQQDMDSGLAVWWDAAQTRPKMMPIIELQTKLRDDAHDDGRRTVFLAGHKYLAVKKVTRRLDEGAWLKLTFTEYSDREPAKRAYNRAKLYTAEYRPAVGGISLSDRQVDTPSTGGYTGPVASTSGPVTSTLNTGHLSEDQKAALRGLGVDI